MSGKRKPASVMLMMDGKLLTVNFLLAALSEAAAQSLGHTKEEVADMDDAATVAAAIDIAQLVRKMSVRGLRMLITSKGQPLGWDEIRTMSQLVVDEVNRE